MPSIKEMTPHAIRTWAETVQTHVTQIETEQEIFEDQVKIQEYAQEHGAFDFRGKTGKAFFDTLRAITEKRRQLAAFDEASLQRMKGFAQALDAEYDIRERIAQKVSTDVAEIQQKSETAPDIVKPGEAAIVQTIFDAMQRGFVAPTNRENPEPSQENPAQLPTTLEPALTSAQNGNGHKSPEGQKSRSVLKPQEVPLWAVDIKHSIVYVNGNPVTVSRQDIELLCILAHGTTCSSLLSTHALGQDAEKARLSIVVRNLQRKLGDKELRWIDIEGRGPDAIYTPLVKISVRGNPRTRPLQCEDLQ